MSYRYNGFEKRIRIQLVIANATVPSARIRRSDEMRIVRPRRRRKQNVKKRPGETSVIKYPNSNRSSRCEACAFSNDGIFTRARVFNLSGEISERKIF